MRRIGLVGVGLLGSTVAARLLEHGFEVIGYDKRTTQLEALRPLPRLAIARQTLPWSSRSSNA